jgi:N-acetyl-alpha-D-muramate 1-phosphate uridylyltransferase
MRGSLPPVCILAGGLGTRLGGRVRETPKPLLDVAGEPFLHYQLRLLRRWGAWKVVLCVGYLGERIEDAIGHDRFGLQISYSYDGPAPAGTLGAVRKAAPSLGSRFLILYGDTYLRLDYAAAADAWLASGRLGLMTVLRNRGEWDRSNVQFDGMQVTLYDKRSPTEEMEWIDYGLGGLRMEALDVVREDVDDLSDLYHALSRRGELRGFAATERFYEIGTPDALAETASFLGGLPAAER